MAAASALALVTLLAACGGGGGDGNGGAAPDAPAAPATPVVPTVPTATLQSADAVDDAALTTRLAERTLMVAQLAGDEMRDQAGRGDLVTSGISCYGDGTRDVVLDDRDASGSISIGDHLHLQFNACRVLMFQGQLQGAVELDVVAPTLSPSAGAWAADLSTGGLTVLGEDATNRTLSGRFHAESRMDVDSVAVQAATLGTEVPVWQLDGPSMSERMLAMKLAKSLDYVNSRGRVDIAYTLDSDTLGGQVSVDSGSNGITGWIGRLPDAGVMRITGKGEVAMRPKSAAGSTSADVGFDGDVNGMAEVSTPAAWTRLASGFLWWAQGLVPLLPNSPAYPIPPAGVPALARYEPASFENLPVQPVFEWTFTIGDLEADTLPVLVLDRLPASPGDDADDGPGRALLKTNLRGARLTLNLDDPALELQRGRRYALRMLRGSPNGPSDVVELEGRRNNTVVLLDVYRITN